jgi:DNA-binding response OmpR family regulator
MKERTVNITLVEDDPLQQRLIQHWLKEAGHQCRLFADGDSLIREYGQAPTNLVILDWELPGHTGLELLQWLRQHHGPATPVLFLTMRDDEQDVVAALRGGADDYLVKPARQQELLARIDANLRRCNPQNAAQAKTVQIGPFTIFNQSQQLNLHGKPVVLTQKEYNLACHLLNNIGQLVSRDQLLNDIWGQPANSKSRTVDTHISRLRKKLGLNPDQGWRLSSIYQSGYRLDWLGD